MKTLSLVDFLQLYIMPKLSDVLKNKNFEETAFEREQRLQIEAEIAARARQEEEAAKEAELQNEAIDAAMALLMEPSSQPVNDPVTQPVKIPRNPPLKRKKKDTKI